MDDIITYTTWSGAPIVYRHLPSGAWCYQVHTPTGMKWRVTSGDGRVALRHFSFLASALKFLRLQPPPLGVNRRQVLDDIGLWASGYDNLDTEKEG